MPLPTLSYVRSGDIALNSGILSNANLSAYGWSQQAHPSDSVRAYALVFHASNVHPSANYNRWDAFLVQRIFETKLFTLWLLSLSSPPS